MPLFRRTFIALGLAAAFGSFSAASAQTNWPERSVRFILPIGPEQPQTCGGVRLGSGDILTATAGERDTALDPLLKSQS